MIKTKEMIVDYRKRRAEHAAILIDGAVVEQVESFKFLGVHVPNKLIWCKHTKTVVKRARQNLFPLRRLKRFGMGPQIFKRFYSCTMESILTGCPQVVRVGNNTSATLILNTGTLRVTCLVPSCTHCSPTTTWPSMTPNHH